MPSALDDLIKTLDSVAPSPLKEDITYISENELKGLPIPDASKFEKLLNANNPKPVGSNKKPAMQQRNSYEEQRIVENINRTRDNDDTIFNDIKDRFAKTKNKIEESKSIGLEQKITEIIESKSTEYNSIFGIIHDNIEALIEKQNLLELELEKKEKEILSLKKTVKTILDYIKK
jgi:hypothetical protein